MSLGVIGVGLHRTGLLSVKVALERLGFGPAYHGFEWAGRADHVPYWQAAMASGGRVDWRRIFEDYRAALDWPMLGFWDRVVRDYPDAKVLLTERDPDAWWYSHLSVLRTIEQDRETGGAPVDPDVDQITFDLLGRLFSGRLYDKRHCLRVFREHNERVRHTVHPDRLLIYRVADGWEPLCRLLDVDVSDETFPWVNARSAFIDNAYRSATRTQQYTVGMPWR